MKSNKLNDCHTESRYERGDLLFHLEEKRFGRVDYAEWKYGTWYYTVSLTPIDGVNVWIEENVRLAV